MLPQDTDWFRNCVAAEPHQYDTFYSTREKLERRAEFDRWLAEVKAQAWEEGESDGRWNEEHQAMIERGNREAIANPYRQGDSNA